MQLIIGLWILNQMDKLNMLHIRHNNKLLMAVIINKIYRNERNNINKKLKFKIYENIYKNSSDIFIYI